MPTAHAHPEHSSLRASRLVAFTNIALMAIQISTGWLTGSHAIVADGVHTLVDLIVDAVLFASLRPLRARMAWLPSVFVSALLVLTGGELLWQGVTDYSNGETAATSVQICALLVAVAVVITREYIARHLTTLSAEINSTHAHAAGVLTAGAWHARIDAISAGGAAIGAVGTMAGFAHLDQMAAALIGAMMLCMGLFQRDGLLRRS